jgi:hypothetical protein
MYIYNFQFGVKQPLTHSIFSLALNNNHSLTHSLTFQFGVKQHPLTHSIFSLALNNTHSLTQFSV